MEDFVDFDLAVKLKEKGFKEECLAYYTTEYTLYNNVATLTDDKYLCVSYIDYEELLVSHNSIKYTNGNYVDAPTISQVLKWLREEYSIHISTKPYPCEDGIMWLYEIRRFNEHTIFVVANKTGFVKEEQAAIAGIEYTLENTI